MTQCLLDYELCPSLNEGRKNFEGKSKIRESWCQKLKKKKSTLGKRSMLPVYTFWVLKFNSNLWYIGVAKSRTRLSDWSDLICDTFYSFLQWVNKPYAYTLLYIYPHSSTLAWQIPWAEEPGRLQSMGSQRVGHDWATSLHSSLSCTGEGNGNPLQCSCLENPTDRGAWWAAIYGVAQSWTWLKRLSSSSIIYIWYTYTHIWYIYKIYILYIRYIYHIYIRICVCVYTYCYIIEPFKVR